MPEIKAMGHSVRRKEDPRFLRGKGTYIDDVTLPGMLYMDIVRSPYPHAKIVNIDAFHYRLAVRQYMSSASQPSTSTWTVVCVMRK